MEIIIRKIAGFSEEEVEILKKAGKLLGAFRTAFAAGEVTELSAEAKALLDAVDEVLDDVRAR